jgi:DNA helicase-2/ATP-dependent DNA helicase PcrA
MGKWLESLNESQRQAVLYGEGPLLIVAGAGTGKTRTLVARVAHLIDRGVPPERILLLTFTRRAAAEMLTRAGRMTNSQVAAKVWGGTFHAVSNRLLRIYGRAIGLNGEFTVMDQSDAADMMNLVRSDLGVAKGERRFPRKQTLIAIYSRTVNAEEKLPAVLESWFPWCKDDLEGIQRIFREYTRRKRQNNVLDYDDLLLYWTALCNAAGTGDAVADRFEHILVDEYQDTNALQARILTCMRKHIKNITVVGDDAQSIYSFRAATVRNMLDFPKQFPGARIVTLEQNYRSIEPILAASNEVMSQAAERFTKNLWSKRPSAQKPILTTCLDERQQVDAVCQNLLTHLERGIALMRQAVLFRAGHHSDMLEVELARRNIPFHKYGGLKFVEAAHVKDMLSFLRILENPYDEISWFRILQMLEGIGPRSAQRIMDDLGVRRPATPQRRDTPGASFGATGGLSASTSAESPGATGSLSASTSAESPLHRLFLAPPPVPPAAREGFDQLRVALAECIGANPDSTGRITPKGQSPAKEPPLPVQVERLRRFYEPIFERLYENPNIRLRDIEQLEIIAGGYRSRGRFIADLTLDPPTSTSDFAQPPFLEEDWLTLSTIHSAKGCEWDVVHIIHAADGMIPSDMATGSSAEIDEERRLFYVAMTRAKDWLYVYFPLRYYRRRGGTMHDRHSYAQLTRFITPEVKSLFEERSTHQVAEDTPAEPQGPADVSQVEDYLKNLWQG